MRRTPWWSAAATAAWPPRPSWPTAAVRWWCSTPTTSVGARQHPQRRDGAPRAEGGPAVARAHPRRARAAPARGGRGRLRPRREGDRRRCHRLRLRAHRPAVRDPLRPRRRPPRRPGRPSSRRSARRPTSCAATTSRAEIGSSLFAAGLVVERSGGLHPARFHAGLTRLADAAGASLHPHTPATAVVPRRRRLAGVDARGATSTPKHVLVATNAYADALVPALRRRVLPMGSFIIATEPLGARPGRGGPAHRAACASTTATCSGTGASTMSGRMVFGGRKRLGAVRLDEARDHLYRSHGRGAPAARRRRRWSGRGAGTWPSRSTACRTAAASTGSGTPPAATAPAWRSTPGSATGWPAPSTAEPLPPFAELHAPPDPAPRAAARRGCRWCPPGTGSKDRRA